MNGWELIYRIGWLLLGILFVIAAVAIFGPQIRQYRELQRREAQAHSDVQLEEEMLQHLKEQQERLRNDPRYVERVAREELGLARPGETVVKFSDDPAWSNRSRERPR